MKFSEFFLTVFAISAFAVSELCAGVTFQELASKIDAGGTCYEISVIPETFKEMKDAVSGLKRTLADMFPENSADIETVEKLVFSSGIMDCCGYALSSVLTEGSESGGDALYRNKIYIAFEENKDAWLHHAFFSKNSDFSRVFASLPESTRFAFVFNTDMNSAGKLLKDLQLPGDFDKYFDSQSAACGVAGVVLWRYQEELCLCLISPAGAEDVTGEIDDGYCVDSGAGFIFLFDNEGQAEAWQAGDRLSIGRAVELEDKAGFVYAGKDIFTDLLRAFDEDEFLQVFLESAVTVDNESFVTVQRDAGGVFFEGCAHTDMIGGFTSLLGRMLITAVVAAEEKSGYSWQDAMDHPGGNVNGGLMIFLIDNKFPANEDVHLLAEVFPGEPGRDFIYRCPDPDEKEAVPVCIMAPEDGYCLVVYSDCSQKYVLWDEISGTLGVVAALQSGMQMPENVFRDWVDIAENSFF